MIQAIIFDMDGLMIDSEPQHINAYNKVLSKFNFNLKKKDTLKYVGISDTETSKNIILKFKLKLKVIELLELKSQEYQKILKTSIKIQKGLLELIEKLYKNNFKLAIASGSNLEDIKIVVKKLKIEKYFSEFISAEFIKSSKPNPEIFLLTANKLNIKPENCLVLEDSPAGLIAAKKANMNCFIIPSRETKNGNFEIADKILNNLTEVFDNINF